MKYTFLCKPGCYGKPGKHYVYIGAWIAPIGYIILQHGSMTYKEFVKFKNDGYIGIEEDTNNIVRIYQAPLEYHARKYAETRRKTIGRLLKKTDNIYIGGLYHREFI